MSLAQLMPRLATLRDEQAEARSEVAWKVLYARRSQPLLVPTDPLRARQAVGFFIRNPLLRFWGKTLLALDQWMPGSGLLSTVKLSQFPSGVLFGTRNLEATALYCGYPGPLQKLTMYYPGDKDEPPRVVKIALQASADPAIEQEAHWLSTLGHVPETADYLPRLLGHGKLPCGRRYLAMLALPQGRRVQRFTEMHHQFLSVLARQHVTIKPWRESDPFLRLQRRMLAVLPLVEPQYCELIQNVFMEIEQGIGGLPLPTCMVHSDFTPWNLGIADGRLFVFDWEYAEANGNPLHDFLHFHLMPRALQRWPMRSALMPLLVADAASHGKELFGADSGVAEACGPLVLHYLLDTVTFYTEASRHLDPRHPVVRDYVRLLECREEWLPRNTLGEPSDESRR
ncbi:cyanate hydratase [Novimethylophilus kurashikiensis]|uniref:Cyanate hydratase n=1 Tax=Novimethylophilus kurashikiensis TaxID=1825523 RepID=A0A2R5FF10_9PROT|nr:phosphotransferase [Novimethylophilus kurashikiensis]GBG14984.1 cyanate hydratase [Novimethylophilus kurashikiensis]